MSLPEMLASIRAHFRPSSLQSADHEAASILKRIQELLDVATAKRVETPSATAGESPDNALRICEQNRQSPVSLRPRLRGAEKLDIAS